MSKRRFSVAGQKIEFRLYISAFRLTRIYNFLIHAYTFYTTASSIYILNKHLLRFCTEANISARGYQKARLLPGKISKAV